ncbi:hypothetical protein [Mesorhizobium sp. M1027]|uniref:hypothetical protein n=1 Tax=Mesorhizobium sp. M1027 TaxID=2957050 RepID=UPI0033360A77
MEVQLGHAVLLSRVATKRGGGAPTFHREKTTSIRKAAGVSPIGQPAPLFVIALVLETAAEWCLADGTKVEIKPPLRFTEN